jgi:WD40 repeat protein
LSAWSVGDGKKRFTLQDNERKKSRERQLLLGDPPTTLLAFSSDGKLFAWFQDGAHVHIADLATGETLHTLPADLSKRAITFSRDGKMLALDGAGPTLVEVATGKLRHEFACHASACSIAFSHDHTLLAAGYPDATVLLWDLWGARTAMKTLSPRWSWTRPGPLSPPTMAPPLLPPCRCCISMAIRRRRCSRNAWRNSSAT